LLCAVRTGNGEDTGRLLAQGADPCVRDENGRTPSSWAAEQGNESIVKLLLDWHQFQLSSKDIIRRVQQQSAKEGVSVIECFSKQFVSLFDTKDKGGRTPLSWAVAGGHEEIVKLLLQRYEIDIESKDKKHFTPLWRAVKEENEAIARTLLEAGAEVNSIKLEDEKNPSASGTYRGHEDIIRLLLNTDNVDLNATNKQNETPLHIAAENGKELAVILLLEKGSKIDVNLPDSSLNQTALFRAAKEGHEAVVKLLLEMGKTHIDVKGQVYTRVERKKILGAPQTPLEIAKSRGHEGVVKLIQEYSQEYSQSQRLQASS
ncbi:ankyrin, partial [Rhizodiscina lignyota]